MSIQMPFFLAPTLDSIKDIAWEQQLPASSFSLYISTKMSVLIADIICVMGYYILNTLSRGSENHKVAPDSVQGEEGRSQSAGWMELVLFCGTVCFKSSFMSFCASNVKARPWNYFHPPGLVMDGSPVIPGGHTFSPTGKVAGRLLRSPGEEMGFQHSWWPPVRTVLTGRTMASPEFCKGYTHGHKEDTKISLQDRVGDGKRPRIFRGKEKPSTQVVLVFPHEGRTKLELIAAAPRGEKLGAWVMFFPSEWVFFIYPNRMKSKEGHRKKSQLNSKHPGSKKSISGCLKDHGQSISSGLGNITKIVMLSATELKWVIFL